LHAIYDPFTLAERLDVTAELAALAARVGNSELAFNATYHRLSALLESGDIAGAEHSLTEVERLAGGLRPPPYTWCARMGRALPAIVGGGADGGGQAFAAFELGTAGDEANAANGFAAQIYALRHYQGRLGELIDILRANADAQPHLPTWRASLARAY